VARTLLPTSFDSARPALTLPISAYGNVVTATRGESVAREVLGSGDAQLGSQVFELAKRPLTYVASATASDGFASTLRVWVDGKEWREAPSFYGATPEDPIYVVSLDVEGAATVTFGDGVRGARLPTGTDNVVAAYRHGAGAARPPAGSIAQIAKAAAGLAGVKQPLAATGGADAESPDKARFGAPRQALTLGRAVSIRDMEAFAAECSGVRAVSVTWAWDNKAQRPVVKVWVIGDGASASVQARLQAVTDPTTPIAVQTATPIPVTLNLAIAPQTGYVGSQVDAAVAAALLAPETGLLSTEQIGIGKAFYFSRLFSRIHAVPGVLSASMTWTRAAGPSASYADMPGEGAYFSFSPGVTLNGTVYPDA
jgi:predicted phage baseplate assembly protein